jgi:SH3-like domain-containing protein
VRKTLRTELVWLLTLAFAVAGVTAVQAQALQYRSVAEPVVILYDAPSREANRLFVLSRDYPVEVIISSGDWVRVRDDTGAFGWVESKSLSERRMVMVRVPVAEARQRPDESSQIAFRAEQGVVLEFNGFSGGWAQVRHRDGATGYVRLGQLWGV